MGQKSSDGDESRAFTLASSPSHLLHRAQQLAADHFAEAMGEKGVTLRQFAVLAAVAERPGRSQTDLVRATGVDRSTLADMVARLEKRGWILREGHAADGRAYSVSLTPAGHEALKAAAPEAEKTDKWLRDLLPKGKRRNFEDALARLAKAAEPTKAERKRLKAEEKAAKAALKAAKEAGAAPTDAKRKAKRR